MAIIQDIVNFVPSWQKHLDESGYLKAPGQTDYHQKAGYNFKENFPNTPGYVADALGKAYQYGTEGIGSFFSGSSFPDAMARAKEESRLNSLGFRGQGFNMDEYNQTMDFARNGFNPNTGLTYGAAQASELTDLERDFPGMSTGDIIDSMNNRQSANRFSGMGQVGPNKSNMNAPAALDMDRFAGVSNLGRNDMDVEQVAQLGNPSMMQNAKSKLSSSLAGLMDFAPFGKKSISGMALRGLGSLFSRNPNSPSYNSRTPGFDYNNLNESMINDFYDSNEDSDTFGTNRFDRAVPGSFGSFRTLADYLNRNKTAAGKAAIAKEKQARKAAKAQEISKAAARAQQAAIARDIARDSNRGGGANQAGGGYSTGSGYNEGNFCFDPSTPIQMADGSTKEIKNIQLGDDTKGGEVTGVFQFKASDEIHDYKGVTVAGSHYVKEDGRFIMVKDSPLSIKIDKIPVVYSLDTTGRRIFINDIEFADYNGDGVAKNFLSNAGVNLSGFDKEVLRQVEQRLI